MKRNLLLTLVAIAISSITFAQVYVDQITGYTNVGGKPAQMFPDFSNCVIQTADDFTVPAGATWYIDSVFAVGSYSETTGAFDSVIVTFFADSSGQPGSAVFVDTIVLDSTNLDLEFEAGLNTTATLTSGTYWVTLNVVMAFGSHGQWFQGAFGTTPIGNEWYIQDPCDLFQTGHTNWLSSTSQAGATKDLMFKLTGLPCTVVSDTTTTLMDNMITVGQDSATYQWIDCDNGNTILPGDTNQSFTASMNGNYACVITYDCALDTTACVEVTCLNSIDNTVTLSLSGNGPVIRSNDTLASYQWIDCDNGNSPIVGDTNQNFSPTASGNYACALISGCSMDTTACTSITISGIEKVFGDFKVSVYPNPTTGLITVENKGLNVSELKVLNVTGKLLITQKSNTTSLDISSLPKGVYILQVITTDGTGYSKIIKE